MNQEALAAILGSGVLLAVFGVVILVFLAIAIFILLFISKALQTVPVAHRKTDPGLVWLLLIPLFNIVWIFIYLPKVADSFVSYFAEKNVSTFGDCGRTLVYIYGGCLIGGFIPFINFIAGPAGLIVMILFLVKLNDCKKQVKTLEGSLSFSS